MGGIVAVTGFYYPLNRTGSLQEEGGIVRLFVVVVVFLNYG